MTGNVVLDHSLFLVLVAAVMLSATLLLVEYRRPAPAGSYLSGPEADGAHLAMNAAMAVTLTPWFAGAGRTIVVAVYVVLAGAFAVALAAGLGSRSAYWAARRTMSGYHLVAAGAMAFATVAMHSTATQSGSAHGDSTHNGSMHGGGSVTSGMGDMAGMPGMDHAMPGPGIGAWILAALFAFDAIGTVVTVAVLPARALAAVAPPVDARAAANRPDGSVATVPDPNRPVADPATVRRLRLSSVPHVVMDLGMVLMLVAAAFR